jgi:primosomal protein N'
MKVMEEEIVRVLTNNTQNNTWTLDSDMSQLVSNSEEEVVVETQIILQQPALPQLIIVGRR